MTPTTVTPNPNAVTDRIRRRKQNELLKSRGVDVVRLRRYAAPADQRAARARLAQLRAAGASLPTIAAKAGLATTSLARIHRGEDVAIDTARRLLAVTVADVSREVRFTGDEMLWHVETLRALGYGMPWQEMTSGITRYVLELSVRRARKGQIKYVSAEITRRLGDLHRAYQNTPATPDIVGLEWRHIRKTASMARKNGYYPPACYDDDLTLDWRSIPDHPWAATDEWCHGHIERLRLILKHPELSSLPIARLTNPDLPSDSPEERQYDRLFDRLQLRPSHEESPLRRSALQDALDDFFDGEGDPLTFCLDHGLVKATASNIAKDHPSLIAHPDYIAWKEAREESRKATRNQSRDRNRAARNEYERKRRAKARADREAAKAQTEEQVAA